MLSYTGFSAMCPFRGIRYTLPTAWQFETVYCVSQHTKIWCVPAKVAGPSTGLVAAGT